MHAFNDLGFGLQALVLFDRDNTVIADLLHRIGDLAANFGFAIGGYCADLGDLVAVLYVTRRGLDRLDDFCRGHVDPALQIHRIHAGGDRLHAFLDDGLGQNRRSGGAVASFVVGA